MNWLTLIDMNKRDYVHSRPNLIHFPNINKHSNQNALLGFKDTSNRKEMYARPYSNEHITNF